MRMKERLQETCNQLINNEDLHIKDEIFKFLETKESYIEIFAGAESYIKIYSTKKRTLSDIVPIVHNFNLKIIDEVTYELNQGKKIVNVIKLNLDSVDVETLEKHQENVKELFGAVLNDNLNINTKLAELALVEGFCKKGVLLFLAISKFENQLVSIFNQSVIVETLVKHSSLSKTFLNYFVDKFSTKNSEDLKTLEQNIIIDLKKIKDINEDKMLRLFFEIIKNTQRTNFFLDKEVISIKIHTSKIDYKLRGIIPQIETFVYHPEFEGLHLRMDKVSRGGLRWSNRKDDYRDEIKSLMIAQESKNSVIIPKGAKGGLIIQKSNITKAEFKKYYENFINSLLDLVDNLVDNKVVHNTDVICYDDDDFYFVVAADKGTSAMSDVANNLSVKRNFWLKDAFASGGSQGYHHKKLGITAKGSIKSSYRFFIEKGVDFYKTSISIVGVGSMNGDVFGNGVLESEKFLLKAGISHKEIFIDPNPDPIVSFKERKRLYEESNSAWGHYDKSKISEGGGVFSRDEKEIVLSDQIKEFLQIKEDVINAQELARYILKAKVDMVYLGGIGTYFKASTQSSVDIGDKENEGVRIDAGEIEADVVCEGANLGMTMQGRIEYALKGGKVNLDSIDNSAGVNTSDHEVNFKILLDTLVQKGFIDNQQRNENLQTLTDFVVSSVLWTNYFQALAISLDEERSVNKLDVFIKSIEVLENRIDYFDRVNFEIPRNNEMKNILTEDDKIVRPVLSTLMLYAKILIQNILLKDEMIDQPAFYRYLFKYFPKNFVAVYENEVINHPLRKEIIAMEIANEIINRCGTTFISDLDKIGEERFILKIKTYLLSNDFFGANDLRYKLYRSDFEIETEKSYKFFIELENSIVFSAKRMADKLESSEINFENVLYIKEKVFTALQGLEFNFESNLDTSNIENYYETLSYLKLITYILEIKRISQINFTDLTHLCYKLVKDLKIIQLLQKIKNITPKDKTQKMLKGQLLKIIEFIIVNLSKELIEFRRRDEKIDDSIESFFKEKEQNYNNYLSVFDEFKDENISVEKLTIIVNQLLLVR